MISYEACARSYALGLCALVAGPALHASEAPPQIVPEGTLDVITVVARPLLYDVPDVNFGALGTMRLQDIPFSLQSYSSALIENQGAKTLLDVLKADASVQDATTGGAYDLINIRGFPIDNSNTLRRNGMALAPYIDVPIESVERIDLLKGPSGFLYGVNAPGGTVNYFVKRPTADPFVSASLEVQHPGAVTGNVDLGGPVGDSKRFGYRAVVAGGKRGDFDRNRDYERAYAYGAFDWKLSDAAILQFDADYQAKDIAGQALIGNRPSGALPPFPDHDTLLGQPWAQYEARTHNINVRLDYEFNQAWKLINQVARSYSNRNPSFPNVFSVDDNGNILSANIEFSPDQVFEIYSTNSFVAGEFSTGGVEHNLTAGISTRYYWARSGGYSVRPYSNGNIFNPVYIPESRPTTFPPQTYTDNEQLSGFVSDVVTLTPKFSMIVGGRYIDYYNESRNITRADIVYEEEIFVPSASLMFKPIESVSSYVSYSEGFEQGGFAPVGTTNANNPLPPIESTQYEAGVKADIGGRLLLTGAVFRIEKSLEYVNSLNTYVQSGEQRHTGVEFGLRGQLTPRLTLLGGATWLDAVLQSTGDSRTEGNRPANTPEWQANIYGEYALRMLPLHLSAGVYYVGDRPLNPQNTNLLPSYVRADLGLRCETTLLGNRTTIRALVENVANEKYWAAANLSRVWLGRGRTISLGLQVEF